VFLRFEFFGAGSGEIAVGVAANRLRSNLLEPLQHFLRFGTIEAKVARRDDRVGAALRMQIGQARVQTDEISVYIGNDRDAHA